MEFQRQDNLLKRSEIEKLNIAVIGLGGVGSYTVESLVRSGILKITLIDYDKIDITNINRQIHAMHSTIGKYKTEVLKQRIEDINPKCEVTIKTEKLTKENMGFLKEYDYVVDACDDIKVKEEVIKLSKDTNVIMAMGMANKIDATKIKITTLEKTSYDPLAKKLRKYKKENHINTKIPVVSSEEEVKNKQGLASTSYVPSVAGLYITNYIIGGFYEKDRKCDSFF